MIKYIWINNKNPRRISPEGEAPPDDAGDSMKGTPTNNNEGGEIVNGEKFPKRSETSRRSNHQRNTSRTYFSFERKPSGFNLVLGMRSDKYKKGTIIRS